MRGDLPHQAERAPPGTALEEATIEQIFAELDVAPEPVIEDVLAIDFYHDWLPDIAIRARHDGPIRIEQAGIEWSGGYVACRHSAEDRMIDYSVTTRGDGPIDGRIDFGYRRVATSVQWRVRRMAFVERATGRHLFTAPDYWV